MPNILTRCSCCHIWNLYPISAKSIPDRLLDRRGSAAPVWHSDNQGSPARQFGIGDFRQELQVEAPSPAFLTCRVVEKVHDISPKSILGSAAFIEVERAHRIHFDLGTFAQGSAQLALESERSLPHLRHGERNNAIRHRLKSDGSTGESAASLHHEDEA